MLVQVLVQEKSHC